MSMRSILVVDDNATNLKLAADVLAFEGYEVSTAADVEQARSVLRQGIPDLLLLDIALPGMDGLTFARELRTDERTRDMVIIALTAFAMVGDEEKARASGCNGYITKPINTRTLAYQLERIWSETADALREKGLNILIVEDDLLSMKLTKDVLTAAGHRVWSVDAGQPALRVITEQCPDLIIIDLILPDMDGHTLVRLIKGNPVTADIPLVAVTSYPEDFPRPVMLAEGFDAYFIKPLNVAAFPENIRQATRRRQDAEGS